MRRLKRTTSQMVVELLTKYGESVATMESCTGGHLASTITNVEGAEDVIAFSAITYDEVYKYRLGVDKKILEEHGSSSLEVARQMAKKIMFFAESTFGIGVTGRFNKPDPDNPDINDNRVYVSIFDSRCRKYYDMIINCPYKTRLELKRYVVEKILRKFYKVIGDSVAKAISSYFYNNNV